MVFWTLLPKPPGYRRRNDLQGYRGYKAGDVRDAGRSPGEGNGNPL